MTQQFRTSPNAVYRAIDDEVIAIQVETSVFYHLSASCEPLLEFLTRPGSSADYLASYGIDLASEAEALDELLETLAEFRLVDRVDTASERVGVPKLPAHYERPGLLKTGDESLKELLVVMGY